MKIIAFFILFLAALSANSVKAPLSKEQLREEADQICSGTISSIQQDRLCNNQSCTDYTLNSIAELRTTSCERNTAATVRAKFYKIILSEPMPGDYGHYPQPQVGETGTIYIKNGEIVHPNGWVALR